MGVLHGQEHHTPWKRKGHPAKCRGLTVSGKQIQCSFPTTPGRPSVLPVGDPNLAASLRNQMPPGLGSPDETFYPLSLKSLFPKPQRLSNPTLATTSVFLLTLQLSTQVHR